MAKTGFIFTKTGSSVVTYEDSYEFISKNVDGYIERVPISVFDARHIDVWVNEEGKFRSDLKPTAVMVHNGKAVDYLVGNIVFTKSNKRGETISLTKNDVMFIQDTLISSGWFISPKYGTLLMLKY